MNTGFTFCAWICVAINVVVAQEKLHQQLSEEAINLSKTKVAYDPTYYAIPYPGGDVPGNKGVCTDVVIRAYRKVGIDLQREVHVDMKESFDQYPNNWGLRKPDTNIDHRRVPNLMKFFSRRGDSLEKDMISSNYLPGDIVAWMLNNGLYHRKSVV